MSTQTIHFHPKPETFKQNAKDALSDKPLRKSLRTAMDMLMTKRKAVLSDEEELQLLRTLCEHIRQRSPVPVCPTYWSSWKTTCPFGT